MHLARNREVRALYSMGKRTQALDHPCPVAALYAELHLRKDAWPEANELPFDAGARRTSG